MALLRMVQLPGSIHGDRRLLSSLQHASTYVTQLPETDVVDVRQELGNDSLAVVCGDVRLTISNPRQVIHAMREPCLSSADGRPLLDTHGRRLVSFSNVIPDFTAQHVVVAVLCRGNYEDGFIWMPLNTVRYSCMCFARSVIFAACKHMHGIS